MRSRRPSDSSNKDNKKSSFKKRSAVGNRSREDGTGGRSKERKKFSEKPKKKFQGGKSKPSRSSFKSKRPASKDKRGMEQRGKSKVGAKPRQMVATSWSAKGEAVVSNPDGKRTLIWSGIPQEKAIVQVTHAGQHQNFGYVKEVIEASPYRIDPKCKRYDRCGGCPFMHMNQTGQDASKIQLFMTAVTEAEAAWHDEQADTSSNPVALTPVVWPTEIVHVGSDEGYRMVSKLVAGRAKHGALRLGARNRNGSIVPIPDCVVTDNELNVIGKKIAHLLDVLKIFPYTPSNRSGVRYVVLRKSQATQQILITLVVTQRTHFIQELAERIYKLPYKIEGVLIHLNSEKGNAIFVRDTQGRVRTSTLVGKREITERLGGVDYRIGAGDFFQVNISVAERLQQDVLEISKFYREHPMIDLYCGVGLFTLALGKEHGWAMGVEQVDGAIRRGKQAAADQDLNVEFVSGDVFEQLDAVERKIQTASPFIVVDPSRSGLADGVVASLDELNPAAVVYVSCHPKSLARDLLLFREMGWTVEDIKVYEMFPHTVHLETLVWLKPPANRELTKRTSTPKRRRMTVRRKLSQPSLKPSTPPE